MLEDFIYFLFCPKKSRLKHKEYMIRARQRLLAYQNMLRCRQNMHILRQGNLRSEQEQNIRVEETKILK